MKLSSKFGITFGTFVLLLGGGVYTLQAKALARQKAALEDLVVAQAVAVGLHTAKQVAATRSVYTSTVVSSLKPHGTSFKAIPEDGEAPLPATFISATSAKLDAMNEEGGIRFTLRSGWNINSEQGITTEFEKRAWANLLEQEK